VPGTVDLCRIGLGSDARLGPRRVSQPRVVGAALVLLGSGATGLARGYGLRHAALFVVGAGFGLVLYQAAFGFTTHFRRMVTERDGRGLRAQMLMLAVATLLFAPLLAAGAVGGRAVGGAAAPASLSVMVGAALFAVGMQVGGG
jgi:hypothetical protein